MRFLPLHLLLGGVCALHALSAPPPAGSYKGPVHAQLLKYLNVRQMQTGSFVFVRVMADWTGLNCTLRKGAIIEAKVETASPHVKGGKGSELALSFSKAQCSGAEMAPLDLVLAAVSYVPVDDDKGDQFPVVRYMSTHSASSPVSVGREDPSALAAASEETIFAKSAEYRAMSQSAARPKFLSTQLRSSPGWLMVHPTHLDACHKAVCGPHRQMSDLATLRPSGSPAQSICL